MCIRDSSQSVLAARLHVHDFGKLHGICAFGHCLAQSGFVGIVPVKIIPVVLHMAVDSLCQFYALFVLRQDTGCLLYTSCVILPVFCSAILFLLT